MSVIMKRYFIAYDRYSGELTPELPKKQIFDKKKKLRSAAQEGSISLHETLRTILTKIFTLILLLLMTLEEI